MTQKNKEILFNHFPKKQGLYDPVFEHDNCGTGFVCDLKGNKSHKIMKNALEILIRMTHRGAVGADPLTGDGAGILLQMPDTFLRKKMKDLPEAGDYGVALVFLPQDEKERTFCIETFEAEIKAAGQKLIGWRDVPVDNSVVGVTARATEPVMKQLFVALGKSTEKSMPFERKLYIIRKKTENTIKAKNLKQKTFFYVTNLSSRTLSYKGLLMPYQVSKFFLDLQDPELTTAIALIHSRYSTNTFPTWDLAQPFRFLAHNGEINTLRGNINWMTARHSLLKTELLDTDLTELLPIIMPNGSDSASLDNMIEFLALTGRDLAQLMNMLVPAAWETNKFLDDDVRAFYDYHACVMEPWDGPASLAVTDGKQVGAVLDRNGLRPSRFIETKDGMVVMASEMGVLDIEPENIKTSGRLTPGKMFMVDIEKGRIVSDEEIKKDISTRKPYKEWVKNNLIDLDDLNANDPGQKIDDLLVLKKAFGYTREDIRTIIKPMAELGQEPIGAMGDDIPIAVLSKNSRLLYNYFKQLFAQVTNPPIDPIREEIVMSLTSYIGPEKNILKESEKHAARIKVKEPILFNKDLAKLENLKTKKISILCKAEQTDFKETLDRISHEAMQAINEGYDFIILSDQGVNQDNMALPALLAMGTVHHHLVRNAVRKCIGIILETAEPREVFHFALLFGYGADAINPYLAYEAVKDLISQELITTDENIAIKNYRKAINKGIKKILSKMGISTLQSYRGAQIFEALGIGEEVINKSFTGTSSRIGGIDLSIIAKETIMRHTNAYNKFSKNQNYLPTGGFYQWKQDGEFHLWNPESIAKLQDATTNGDYKKYQDFAKLINDQSNQPTTLRGLLNFKTKKAIPLDHVESVDEIVKRFCTGAMSFGSISRGAHETLAIAMNRLKGRSNTGEGGENPARFTPLPNGDSKRSAIKQVASGRFGVNSNYLANADEIQIKIAQGAKPGEGGQLPGHKVSVTIAKTRYTTPGVTLISPPPHHDIYSIEDLAQLIYDLKNANPYARISVKLVSEVGVGTIAAGVAKAHADMILISGGDGGTGASPLSSMKHAGLGWELGLAETHQTLVLNDLRSRVRLQTDGQMRTGKDVVVAAMLGAEEYGFSTAPLIVMGCVMLRHCHINNCSVGVATQDNILQTRFRGKIDALIHYMKFVAEEAREIMAAIGVRNINELIGRTDYLEVNQAIVPWKAKKIDYSKVLYRPDVPEEIGVYKTKKQNHAIDNVLDWKLVADAKEALEHQKEVKITSKISNTNRTVGAILSYHVSKNYSDAGLNDNTIHCKFNGYAGQSFGTFLAHGITFELEGMANDYVGKAISGGKIIVYPSKKASYIPEENILIGNTTFYGAIHGEAYIQGVGGERFCIRNSGLNAVIEGVGDHACEYMTGGNVVIIGKTGRNFAAGMSGGTAYVWDYDGQFKDRCNMEMVEIEELTAEDHDIINTLLRNHKKHTHSKVVNKFLNGNESAKLVKVMPIEYKHILTQKKLEEKMGLADNQ
ncbi:MAG: glutamate synthase large subunit [bacterium]|nr:glutamate synthase large subunit [bacterium]